MRTSGSGYCTFGVGPAECAGPGRGFGSGQIYVRTFALLIPYASPWGGGSLTRIPPGRVEGPGGSWGCLVGVCGVGVVWGPLVGSVLPWRGLGGHDEKQAKRTPLVHEKGAPRTTKKNVRAQFGTAGGPKWFPEGPLGSRNGSQKCPGGKGGSKMHRWSPRGGKRQCQPPF